MTDQNQTIRDDIAFLRQLAEDGREGPLRGGSIMLVAGVLFGSASIAVAWAMSHPGATGRFLMQWAWPATGVVFLAFMALTLRRQGRPKGAAAQSAGLAWSALGWAMFTIILSIIVIANRNRDAQVFTVIAPAVLALYGSAWGVAAILTKARWIRVVAAGSFAMAPVCAWLSVDPAMTFYTYGASLYVLTGLPGLLVMLKSRKA